MYSNRDPVSCFESQLELISSFQLLKIYFLAALFVESEIRQYDWLSFLQAQFQSIPFLEGEAIQPTPNLRFCAGHCMSDRR